MNLALLAQEAAKPKKLDIGKPGFGLVDKPMVLKLTAPSGRVYRMTWQKATPPTQADIDAALEEATRQEDELSSLVGDYKDRPAGKPLPMGNDDLVSSAVGEPMPIGGPKPGKIAELANLGGSKPYVKAKDTFKENERKKRERELDPQQTFDVLNETGKRIQEGVTNMVPSLDKIPGGRLAQKIAPGIIGPGDKGYAGHVAGLAGSVAATPVDIAADVVKFASTGEWQAAANILLKTGAIVPVGKGVVAAGTSLASKTKAGRGLGVAKAIEDTVKQGMSEQQALATLTRLGASKQVALQAIKAAKTADTVSAPVAGSISNVAGAKRKPPPTLADAINAEKPSPSAGALQLRRLKDAKEGEPFEVTLWHGTPDKRFASEPPADKPEFYRARPPVLADDAEWLNDTWFTDDRNIAVTYADPRRAWDYQNAEPGVLQRTVRLRNPKVIDMQGQKWNLGESTKAANEARAQGYDGVVFKNIIDPYSTLDGKGAKKKYSKPSTTVVVFNPENIRRVDGDYFGETLKQPQPSPSSIPETPQPKPLTGGKVDMGYKPVRSTPGQAPDVSGIEDAVNVPNLPGALPQIRTTNVDWKRGINVDDPRLNPQSDEFSPAFLSATHRALVGGDIDPFADINDVYQDVYTALKNRGAEDAGDKAARASAMGDALKDVQGLLKRPKLSEMEQERLDALKGVTARKYRIAYKDKNGNWRYDDRQKPNMVDLSGMPKDVAEDILDFALANADDERYYVNRSMLDEYRRTGANKPSYLRESEFILRDVPNAEEAFRAVGESSNILIPRHLVVKYERNLKSLTSRLRDESSLPPASEATLRDATDELGMVAPRHEDVDALRDVMGLSSREASPQTVVEWMEKAKTIDADRVATRVLSEDGGVASAPEQAALAVRLNGLRRELQAARDDGDAELFAGILDQVNRYADALDKAGSEAGRAMNVRRVVMNDIFDEWSLTRTLEKDANRAAKDSEIKAIRDLVDENDKLTRELEEAKAAAAEAKANASVGRSRSASRRNPEDIKSRKEVAAKTISEEVQRLLASPVSMVLGAGAPGAGGANLSRLGAALRDYAAALVDEGIVGLENVVGAIKEAFPALERQQIIDAMADYGSEPRTLSEAQKELSRLRQELKKASTKGQGQLAEKAAKAQAAKRSTIEANRAKARLKQAEKLEREGKKSEAKALRADIESRAKAQRELDDEATRLDEAAAKQQQKQFDRESDLRAKIAEYERKIKSGDFAPKTKEELAKSKRVEFLEARRDLVRKRFDSMRNTAKSKDSVAFKVVKGAADTMRSAQLGFDLGAILRQGMFGISHPKKMLMSVRDGLKSMRSDEALQVIQNRLESGEINGKPATAIRSKAGLYMADTLSAPEETFISGLISKIPGIGKVYDAGERFTTGFLNTYRAEMFDSFAKRHPDATPDELKDWARWINSTSGRSNLREVPKIASVLLTSPRYAASRFEVLGRIVASPALLKNKAEREVFIEAVKTGATIIGAMKMAEAAGAEINFDPKSSDFLKIRVGDTVYDPTAGLGGTARLLIRSMMPIFTGEKTKFGKDVASEVGKFSTYKVGPGLSTLYETRTGQTLSGFDVPEDEKGWNAFLPVIVAQAKENIKSDGLAKGLLKTAPEVVGIGSNTYKKKGD